MHSGCTDSELRHWLRWASEGGNTPSFVRTVAEAARMACSPDYVLLRPVPVELKRQHPEPQPGPGVLDDPELARWLQWAARGGHVPSFLRALVEAAMCASAGDYELLRPVQLESKRRHPEGLCKGAAAT